MNDITTIPIQKDTRDKLKELGMKGETYDDIINRILENIEYEKFMEIHYKRLKEKDQFVSFDEI